MAGADMVASSSTDDNKKGGARKGYRGFITRLSYEEKELKTPTGGVDYVEDLLQTISPDEYGEAMRWILDIALTNDLNIQVILKYIRSFGKTALRKKLCG
jgi:hypothetical protein